jgi:hypothetical protein
LPRISRVTLTRESVLAESRTRGWRAPRRRPAGDEGAFAFEREHGVTLSFDLGTHLLNIAGRYLRSNGFLFAWDKCQVTSSCRWTTFPLK